jgi:hypothetical protein
VDDTLLEGKLLMPDLVLEEDFFKGTARQQDRLLGLRVRGKVFDFTDLWTFGNSMSAVARPKRWGISRQAKGQGFDPTKFELFTPLTRRGVL